MHLIARVGKHLLNGSNFYYSDRLHNMQGWKLVLDIAKYQFLKKNEKKNKIGIAIIGYL